jgi:hypothetical protein
MLVAMLVGFVGFAVYAWVDGAIGRAIVMVGIVVMAVAIGFNIAIYHDENRSK